MLFARRTRTTYLEKARIALWPRRNWSRSVRYYRKRLMHLRASPHSVSAGFASGIFASFSPFFGFHYVVGFCLSYAVRGNLLASAVGTTVGNPITYPFMWAASYGLGLLLVPGAQPQDVDTATLAEGAFGRSMEHLMPIVKPMLVGSLTLGLIAAVATYLLAKPLVAAYQAARHDRFVERHRRPSPPLGHA